MTSPEDVLAMDELLRQMKLEVEEERKRIYMEKYGKLSEEREAEKITRLNDFN